MKQMYDLELDKLLDFSEDFWVLLLLLSAMGIGEVLPVMSEGPD
jgi:hypothetical protein